MYWLYKLPQNISYATIVHVEEDRIVINEKEFLLSDLTSRSDFNSYCKFVFPFKQLSPETQRKITDENGGQHFYPVVINTFDIFGFTYHTKLKQDEFGSFQLSPIVVSMIFYPHSTNFKDALLTIIAPGDDNTPFRVTTKNLSGEIIDYVPDQILTDTKILASPKCVLSVASVNDDSLKSQTIKFTYRDVKGIEQKTNFEAKVRASAGYLSHREISVVDGEAIFKWIPLGLSPGTKAEIQIEIGKYTRVCFLTVEG